MKKVCSVCGGEEVQVMAWVDINSGRLTEIPDKPSVWCDDCSSHTKPIEQINYKYKK